VKLWVDAQLSPALAPWITEQFGIEAYSVKWLGYRDATDAEIFHAARKAAVVVMTKDSDFIEKAL
jgi:predicted nuclease of predicted toxin-antitoxin system